MNKINFRVAIAGAIAAAVLGGGIALAAGPANGGVIQGCYDSGGNLKVVAALPCPKGYTALAWNQQGSRGADGAAGESAYQVWRRLGNTGTEQDFIQSLRGPAGADGADGGLALAGQTCPRGRFVTGFDESGELVCRTVLADEVKDQGVDCEPLHPGDVADFHNCDLSGVDLSGASLRSANFSGANLSGANLSDADLDGADLEGADLDGANLSGATLSPVLLHGASLENADLHGADLTGSDLGGTDLSLTDLTDADLSETYFAGAIMASTIVTGTNFTDANFTAIAHLFVAWDNTTCPDGTNSDSHGLTCAGHLFV
jgi:hypothetical protein